MHQILAHSTESPQEAEELSARLRAAGVDFEVKEHGAGALLGMLEATRHTWEIWVPEPAEAAARKVIDEESKALEAEQAGLEAELEAEAVASAPPELEKPPEPSPAKVVTRNARIAGALLVAHCFLGVARELIDTVRADEPPLGLQSYVRWIIELVIAVALWNGSRGAWKLSLLWVLSTSLYFGLGALGVPWLTPITEAMDLVGILLLLVGPDTRAFRVAGVGLWVATRLFWWFPLTLAPPALIADSLVGQWENRAHRTQMIAFCADGRFIDGAIGGKWRRVSLNIVEITRDATGVERHLYWARPDHLTYTRQRWDPVPNQLCGSGK